MVKINVAAVVAKATSIQALLPAACGKACCGLIMQDATVEQVIDLFDGADIPVEVRRTCRTTGRTEVDLYRSTETMMYGEVAARLTMWA